MFLAVGVILAILAGILVYTAAGQAATKPSPYADTVPIVVAKDDVPERTVLTADMLVVRDYPKVLIPAGAIPSVDVAARQTTLVKIPAGAPVLTSQITSGGGATGISLTLERGKVYVAFPVSDPLTAANLVKVGDRVDILATITPAQIQSAIAAASPGAPIPARSPETLSGAVTQTVLQNLEVVSVVGKTLTFVVDHQTSLILKSLRDSGVSVDIVIRSRNEPGAVKTDPVDPLYIVQNFGFR